MLPQWNTAEGTLSWQRSCTSDNSSLRDSCLEQFRFADKDAD
jgi:prepilin peptidase dependent protein D